MRDTKSFVNKIFYRDLDLADWRTVYQPRNSNEMNAESNRFFRKILEKNAPNEMKICSNNKKTISDKHCMTKKLNCLLLINIVTSKITI